MKEPPYVGDVWVPTLLIDHSRFVKIFVLSMQDLIKLQNKILKIKHVRVTFRLLN